MKRSAGGTFACQECGQEHSRWAGRCNGCGAWNSIVEEAKSAAGARPGRRPTSTPRSVDEIPTDDQARLGTGMSEFDRVLGGGLVPGSAVLVGGDPGVGKSTLLLEVAAHRAGGGRQPLYITAEESDAQVALRAERLGLKRSGLLVLAENRLEPILDLLLDEPPDLVVIDSIQTISKEGLSSAPGSVAQVRDCAADLVQAARHGGFPLVLIGHVTKEGMLAGPKVLEHLVDAVLYFEGDQGTDHRILRAVKNRHGPSGEVAVFTMGERGLADPERPAAAFLGPARGLPGAVVAPALEGTRVFLVEIQALTCTANHGPPRVRANGIEPTRATMLSAVLGRRAGLDLGDQDIHVNVAGGFRLTDPGCDLAICLAIASSFLDRPVAPGLAVFGEVGLGGEVRSVRAAGARLREAAALGFEQACAPRGVVGLDPGPALRSIERLSEVLEELT